MGCFDESNERRGEDCWLIAAQSLAIAASMISVFTLAVLWNWSLGITGIMIPMIFANIVGLVLFEIPRCYMPPRRCILDIAGFSAVLLSVSMLVIKTAYLEYSSTMDLGLGAIVGATLWASAAFSIVFINSHTYPEQLVTAQCWAIVGFVCSVSATIETGYLEGFGLGIPLIVANTVELGLVQIPRYCFFHTQIPWYCFFHAAGFLAAILSMSMLAIGIYDSAIQAMVGAFDWAIAALKILLFVRSDQFARWIEEHKETRASDMELTEQEESGVI